MNKILKINDVPANDKEFKKFLSTEHGTWDMVRFTMVDPKTGTTYPKDDLVEGAKVLILKQMILDQGNRHACDIGKLLEDFEQAVRDEANRSAYEGQDESW